MGADVALLQEAAPPPDDVVGLRDATLPPAEGANLGHRPREAWDSHSWNSDWWHGRGWNALYDRWPMVVKLSDRVEVEWFRQVSPVWGAEPDEIEVSGFGTITAARVTPKDGSIEPFIAVSMYGRWLGPHPSVKTVIVDLFGRLRSPHHLRPRPSSATRTRRRIASLRQVT